MCLQNYLKSCYKLSVENKKLSALYEASGWKHPSEADKTSMLQWWSRVAGKRDATEVDTSSIWDYI